MPKIQKLPSQINEELESFSQSDNTPQETQTKKPKKDQPKNLFLPHSVFILSILTCLSFFIYQKIKTNGFSVPKLPSIPTNQINLSNPTPAKKQFSFLTILSQNNLDLEIFTAHIAENSIEKIIAFPQNYNPDVDTFPLSLQLLQKQKISSNSDFVSSFPEGSVVREYITQTNQTLIYQSLITTPEKNIIIYLKSKNQFSLSDHKDSIKQLLKTLYWESVALPSSG